MAYMITIPPVLGTWPLVSLALAMVAIASYGGLLLLKRRRFSEARGMHEKSPKTGPKKVDKREFPQYRMFIIIGPQMLGDTDWPFR